jgi:hypothetical protein
VQNHALQKHPDSIQFEKRHREKKAQTNKLKQRTSHFRRTKTL